MELLKETSKKRSSILKDRVTGNVAHACRAVLVDYLLLRGPINPLHFATRHRKTNLTLDDAVSGMPQGGNAMKGLLLGLGVTFARPSIW
jgi:hypothetical protein